MSCVINPPEVRNAFETEAGTKMMVMVLDNDGQMEKLLKPGNDWRLHLPEEKAVHWNIVN